MSVQLAAQDFTTPDKGGPNKMPPSSSSIKNNFPAPSTTATGEVSQSFSLNSVTPTESTGLPAKNTVTPQASGLPPMGPSGKQVRFGAEEEKTSTDVATTATESPAAANSKRGLVSRRGGRYVSPGRPLVVNENAKATFRAKSDGDGAPGLSSTNSVGLVSMPSTDCEKEKESNNDRSEAKAKPEESGDLTNVAKRPMSISCDTSTLGPTSPLVSTKSTPQKDGPSFDDADSKSYVQSPVPSTSADRFKKTPTKSPSRFQSLPSLNDTLNSPGIFLSPGPSTPLNKSMRESFEKENNTEEKDNEEASFEDKVRDYTKEKFALTPTNFSVDYGKSPKPFDHSNVLNWLQSPTANGLFSPGGGLNSVMNTPKGPIVPRTPGTPTVSTSFFFSDVDSLRTGDNTPKRDGDTGKSPNKKGLSNIICISPLASSRNRHGGPHAANTPINYHDVFASPNPLLEDSPVKSLLKKGATPNDGKQDPSLDAVHRDLMQDEDLSVLLQLAGGNTPKADMATSAGVAGVVFRASGSKASGDSKDTTGLQLPVIGDREGDSTGAKLARKSQSREHGDGETLVSASLSIRKSSSNVFPDKETSLSSTSFESQHPGKALSEGHPPAAPKSASKPPQYPYSRHPYPPRPPSQEVYPYSSLPPGMRPAGRMSVVVGGPPPSRRASDSGAPTGRPLPTSAHRRHSYSPSESYPPPGMSYPPPAHGHYPHHAMHMGAMPSHPYHSHYSHPPARHHGHAPPPSHMPMYSSQHHTSGSSKPAPSPCTKKPKAAKSALAKASPAKRPSLDNSDSGKAVKKQKKSPGAAKKKNKSPQLTDRADRQKAAQTIHSVNAASGGKNDKAAALAAAILRGVTMRPSGKWQAQLYFAGKSRYIGVFDTREKAALAYEIAREKLKSEKSAVDGALTPKQTENAVNAARKAAFDGVNEKDPRA